MANYKFALFFLCFLSFSNPSRAQESHLRSNPIAEIAGLFLGTTIHEAGHAVVGKNRGLKIDRFRPYPHFSDDGHLLGGSVSFMANRPDGSVSLSMKDAALISSAGSTSSLLFAIIAPPLLPQISNSDFATTINFSILFGIFDGPFYTTSNLANKLMGREFKGASDWSMVSLTTGISIEWWCLISYSASYLVYQHYRYWRDKALEEHPSDLVANSAPTFKVFQAHW